MNLHRSVVWDVKLGCGTFWTVSILARINTIIVGLGPVAYVRQKSSKSSLFTGSMF